MVTHTLSASACEQANASVSADCAVIANFAWQHLKAASLFRDRVTELEERYREREFGDHFTEIRAYASACVMSSAASLEGLINELFIAKNGALRSMLSDFEKEFWGKIERKPILDKYQHAITMLGLPLLEDNTPAFQDADALIGLRNTLVHYKPTWDTDQPRKITLIEALRGKYPTSSLLNENTDFVTMQSMSSGCCKWAVRTTIEFIRYFDERTHLDDDKLAGFWTLEN